MDFSTFKVFDSCVSSCRKDSLAISIRQESSKIYPRIHDLRVRGLLVPPGLYFGFKLCSRAFPSGPFPVYSRRLDRGSYAYASVQQTMLPRECSTDLAYRWATPCIQDSLLTLDLFCAIFRSTPGTQVIRHTVGLSLHHLAHERNRDYQAQ